MAMRTGRRWAATGLAAALVLAGCSGSGEEADPGGNGGRQVGPWPQASFASALEPYDSCGALLEDVQARAAGRVGPYGLEGTSMVGFATSRTFEQTGAAIDVATDGPVASAPAAASDAAERSSNVGDGSDSSATNTQVAGVDEPDLVKIDGTTLYSTVDGRLSIVDLAGDTPVLQGSLDLPAGTQGGGIPAGIGQPQLLVEGDRALTIAQGWGATGGDGPMTDDLPGRWTPGVPSTELTLIDVSDRTAPRILERLSVDGTLLGARLVDGRAHLVTSTGGPRLDFVYPTGNGGEPVAEATNQKVIETSVIEDWLPQARALGPDGELRRAGPAVACEAVSHPGVDAGEGTVTVLSVDVDGGTLADHDATAVQAAGETIYASAGTLYVATHEMPPPEALEDPASVPSTGLVTSIHAFDLADAGPAAYLATGEVEGRLLNQFAMDEHEGVLRVATTVDGGWGRPTADVRSESFVTTLERREGELVELGKVGDMGRGEQIHSVRFLGEVGYVVTFRQVDPLYTIDLSDPASPTVTGELKIPGFSSYLHPTEPGKLVGIGQDADPETGMTTGTQVSVFDVSDPADPLRTAQWTLPGGSSTAEGDHHAFLWWAAEDLLVVPMSSMFPTEGGRHPGGWFEGAIGLDVTDAAIGERGRIVHEPRPWIEPTPPESTTTTSTTTSSTTTSTTAPPSTTSTTAPSSATTTEPTTTTTVVCVEPDCGPGDGGGRDGADEAATSVAPEPGIPAPVPPGPVPAPPLPGPGAPIVRSLVVEGRLVTVSHLGIEVSRLADLTELGWLTIAR
jgi:hypothetical protein